MTFLWQHQTVAELVYLDETGSVGKGANKQRYLTLVAAAVSEESVQPLADRMRKIAADHLGAPVPLHFEFHAVDIWNNKGVWSGKTAPELLAVMEEVIGLLVELDISVFHSTIDKPALHAKYAGAFDQNAYILALQFLAEKLDGYRTTQVRRILIADEAKEQQLRAVNLVRDMQQWASGEVPGRQLKSIIDSIHFVESKNSPGVQLADMVAFVIHRFRMGSQPHPNIEAAIGRMRSVIDDQTRRWRGAWP